MTAPDPIDQRRNRLRVARALDTARQRDQDARADAAHARKRLRTATLRALATGITWREIVILAGVHRDTINEWRKDAIK